MRYYHTSISTPLGTMHFITNEDTLLWASVPGGSMEQGMTWLQKKTKNSPLSLTRDDSLPLFTEIKRQLDAYFQGKGTSFDLPIQLSGTPFQQRVWNALQEIPAGNTWTYKQMAEHIGNSNASRAVGGACRANPIPVIIPCHRVVGSDGSMTGYGGKGGVGIKVRLLEIEHKSMTYSPYQKNTSTITHQTGTTIWYKKE
jgi:methylated-DNA-[protein]-cysteine S-methyltransferase